MLYTIGITIWKIFLLLFSKGKVSILAHYTNSFTNRTPKKGKLQRILKLMFIFLKAFRDSFVTVAEATSQSSTDARSKLHKIEVTEEGLLLGKSAEYTASQAHRLTPATMTQPSIPLLAT
jgi:hypothetical protein